MLRPTINKALLHLCTGNTSVPSHHRALHDLPWPGWPHTDEPTTEDGEPPIEDGVSKLFRLCAIRQDRDGNDMLVHLPNAPIGTAFPVLVDTRADDQVPHCVVGDWVQQPTD